MRRMWFYEFQNNRLLEFTRSSFTFERQGKDESSKENQSIGKQYEQYEQHPHDVYTVRRKDSLQRNIVFFFYIEDNETERNRTNVEHPSSCETPKKILVVLVVVLVRVVLVVRVRVRVAGEPRNRVRDDFVPDN